MFCKNCGKKVDAGEKFCASCGTQIMPSVEVSISENKTTVEHSPIVSEATIKCGNCGYVGPGERARRTFSQVLAWICIIFFWPVTVIYFISTSKYRCPKCHSNFLGIKNNNGIYMTQGRDGSRIALVVGGILGGIAVIGILSSVVLASLSTARSRGIDAQIESSLSSLRSTAEIYYANNENSYSGFCEDPGTLSKLNEVEKISDTDGARSNYDCNDSNSAYGLSFPLKIGNYWCIDSTGASLENEASLGNSMACSS